jgi:cyclophilin family peptidyl-prolyl cis-trans isomerase
MKGFDTQIKIAVLTLALWATAGISGNAANKLDPELVPPDVTLPGGSPGAAAPAVPASTTPAPGQVSATDNRANYPGGLIPAQPAPPPPGSKALSGPQSPTSVPSSPGAPSVSADDLKKPDPVAVIETEKGTIVIRLFRKLAPKTVANFIDLSGKGFYNNLIFHRVEPGFCIQTGCPRGDGSGVYFEPGSDGKQIRMIPLEVSDKLKHNAAGVVAMARFPKNPNTASCQFYITLAPQSRLDGQYSIFGGVISGMDVVNKIAKGDKMLTVTVQEQPESPKSD